MSGGTLLYLVGMALIFAGQRMFAGTDVAELGLTLAGVAAALAALGLRLKARASAPSDAHRAAHTRALLFGLLGASALLLYGLSTDPVVQAMGLDDDAARRWSVPFQALWPIAVLAGAWPMIALDLAIRDSPKVLQPRRITQAAGNWLAAALGVSLVFPLNYLASDHNQRWDLAYFKTTEVGGATRALVDNLNDPVTVRIFEAPASDVTRELRAYFEQLEGPNLSLEVLDHASEPKLVEEMKIRDNGYVAITIGEDTKSWKVGEELDKAKRNLKKLDTEFQKRLLELARGKQIAYFTAGHGEMSWSGDAGPDRKASTLKKVIEAQSYRTKTLGLSQGLADAVPDDAGVVLIMGPTEPFLDVEISALKAYVAGGGAIFVALEPGEQAPDGLLEALGLREGEGELVSEATFARITGGRSDMSNIITNRFSSHASTTTLSKNSQQLAMVLSGSGWLEETKAPGFDGKVTITVRSMPDNWADLDGDLSLGEGESKKIRPVAAAVTGPVAGAAPPPAPDEAGDDEAAPAPAEWRAVVIADASAFSDFVLTNVRGNQQYVWDSLHWLTGDEDASGTVESEEDVKIQHTNKDQVYWFYGTILGVPLLVLLAGAARVRARRKGGEA